MSRKITKGKQENISVSFKNFVRDTTFYPVMGIRLLRINYTRILDSADAILSFANSKKLCRRNTQENIRHALLATNTEESILFLVSFYNTFITRQSSIG